MAFYRSNKDDEKGGLHTLYLRGAGVVLTILYTFSHYLKPEPGITELFCWPAVLLFAFLMAEGVMHTQDKWLYYVRILLFAALAEIPFNMLNFGVRINTDLQNALFTLLLCYCLLYAIDFVRLRSDNIAATLLAELIAADAGVALAKFLNLEFGAFAVLSAIACYISLRVTYSNWFRLAAFLAICMNLQHQVMVPLSLGVFKLEVPVEMAALPALLLIYFYNGKRGTNNIKVRYASYLFYPVLIGVVLVLKLCGITI